MGSPVLNAVGQGYQSFRRKAPRIIRMPDFRGNFATGNTIVCNVGTGPTYHGLYLQFYKAAYAVATEAEITAQVSRIRITVDGDPKIDLTGTEAAMFANLYNSRANAGAHIQGGVLPIYLSRPWWPEFASQDGPAWGTADVGAMTIEVTFTGTVTITGCNPRAYITSDPEPLGRHLTIRRLVDNQGAAGLKAISDFKPDIMKQLVAVHVDKVMSLAAGPITTHTWKANQQVEWEGEGEIINSMLRAYEYAPVTGWTHFIFALRGRPLDSLPMVAADLRLELTTAAALGNFNLLCEYAEGESLQAA